MCVENGLGFVRLQSAGECFKLAKFKSWTTRGKVSMVKWGLSLINWAAYSSSRTPERARSGRRSTVLLLQSHPKVASNRVTVQYDLYSARFISISASEGMSLRAKARCGFDQGHWLNMRYTLRENKFNVVKGDSDSTFVGRRAGFGAAQRPFSLIANETDL